MGEAEVAEELELEEGPSLFRESRFAYSVLLHSDVNWLKFELSNCRKGWYIGSSLEIESNPTTMFT